MSEWNASEVVAWTEVEGPAQREPGSPVVLTFALAIACGGLFLAMFGNDTLCTVHLIWAEVLEAASLVTAAFAAVGLIRSWAIAPRLTLAASLLIIPVNSLGLAHTAGTTVIASLALAIAATTTAMVAVLSRRASRWDHAVERALAPEAGSTMPPATVPVDAEDKIVEPAS